MSRRRAPSTSGFAFRLRRRLYGVVFLGIIGALIALTVAVYNKTFVDVVPVSLKTDRVGNQLNPTADVKLRGMIVGEVRDIRTDGTEATVELALDPEQVAQIPAGVEARLLPKTLFGEKFVDLVVPPAASTRAIRAGDVITRDRSSTAIELERVLDDVLPLLRTVRPADLNATLYALSTALEGRGNEIGENLERVDTYFTRLNPKMKTLQEDISGLADLTETYSAAAPDLLRILRNTAATQRTVVAKRETLAQFLVGTTVAARTTESVLAENEDNLIRLAGASRPVLGLLAKYSPEYPCLLSGLANYDKPLSDAFGGGYQGLHITLEIVGQRGPYRPGTDDPTYSDRSGPDCHTLPNPTRPSPGAEIDDGAANFGDATPGLPGGITPSAFSAQPNTGPAGTGAERDFLAPILASSTGTKQENVSDLATTMFAPMARGTAVRLS